ncbi:hypothetical protein Btru_017699 [Bulinus truncatus]|nr:hypothetical protein Btru_017699 [Bulinus truncatus]
MYRGMDTHPHFDNHRPRQLTDCTDVQRIMLKSFKFELAGRQQHTNHQLLKTLKVSENSWHVSAYKYPQLQKGIYTGQVTCTNAVFRVSDSIHYVWIRPTQWHYDERETTSVDNTVYFERLSDVLHFKILR